MGKRQEILESTIETIKMSDTLKTFDEYFCSMYIDHPYWKSHEKAEVRFKGMTIKFSKSTNGMFQIDNNNMIMVIHPEIEKMTDQYFTLMKSF